MRPFRALVVDDEVEDRIQMRHALVQAGFEVEEAENGRRAMDRLREHDYDMLVVDILMPQVDGYELLSHLKKKDPEVLARTVVASRLDLRDMKVFFSPLPGPAETGRRPGAGRDRAHHAEQRPALSAPLPRGPSH